MPREPSRAPLRNFSVAAAMSAVSILARARPPVVGATSNPIGDGHKPGSVDMPAAQQIGVMLGNAPQATPDQGV